MYVKNSEETFVTEKSGDRWEICICSSPGEFQQVSFVNSINTKNGGTHVDHVVNAVVKNIQEKVKKNQGKRRKSILLLVCIK